MFTILIFTMYKLPSPVFQCNSKYEYHVILIEATKFYICRNNKILKYTNLFLVQSDVYLRLAKV